MTIEVVDPGDPWWLFSGIRCKSRTRSTKSATSTIVDHACSCVSNSTWWTLARPACINDSMAGLSHGPDLRQGTSILYGARPRAVSLAGRPATSESSRTLSSGLYEGRLSGRRGTSHLRQKMPFTAVSSCCAPPGHFAVGSSTWCSKTGRRGLAVCRPRPAQFRRAPESWFATAAPGQSRRCLGDRYWRTRSFAQVPMLRSLWSRLPAPRLSAEIRFCRQLSLRRP